MIHPDGSLQAYQTASVQRVVLTGFMGSGKTTVGRLLAQKVDWQFVDLDAAVQERLGRTVPEIFREQGEACFRSAETEALGQLLLQDRIVIALGGGAPVTAANRELLSEAPQTAVIHLEAPFDVLFARCVTQSLDPQATARPLLGERLAAEGRYRQRLGFYTTVAHHTMDVSSEDAAGLAGKLASLLIL